MRWRRASRAETWSRVGRRWRSSEWRVSDLEFWELRSRIMLFVAWLIRETREVRSTSWFAEAARPSVGMPLLAWLGLGLLVFGRGCWFVACCCMGRPGSMVRRMKRKISNESGFSGVAAVMPKLLPAGRVIWWVRWVYSVRC